MAIQLSEAKTSLENYKKDISDVDDSIFIEWCNFIQRFIYRNVVKVDPERFIQTSTINISPGTINYSLPAGFNNITPKGCGIFEVDSNGNNTDRALTRTNFGSSIRGFYISGSNIVMTPTPVKAETLRLRYIPNLTKFTSLNDYFTVDKTSNGVETIPEEYMEMLKDDLGKFYSMWDEDGSMISYEDAKFARSLDDYLRDIRREANVFGLPDFSRSF